MTPRNESHLIRACAEEHGRKVRAVQLWRKNGDPRWSEFLRRRAVSAETMVQMAILPGAAETMSPQQLEAAASRRLFLLNAAADQFMQRGEFSQLASVTKSANDTHKMLVDAQARNAELAKLTGDLVSAAKVAEWLNGHIAQVKDRLENLPDLLASRITDLSEVHDITRVEVDSMLHEFSVAAGNAPWRSKTSASGGGDPSDASSA